MLVYSNRLRSMHCESSLIWNYADPLNFYLLTVFILGGRFFFSNVLKFIPSILFFLPHLQLPTTRNIYFAFPAPSKPISLKTSLQNDMSYSAPTASHMVNAIYILCFFHFSNILKRILYSLHIFEINCFAVVELNWKKFQFHFSFGRVNRWKLLSFSSLRIVLIQEQSKILDY